MDRNNYNTKQRDEIVEFFSRHRGSCFTAKDIITSGEVTVGEATVYRTLTKLANQGVLKRFTGDGSGACYQLMDEQKCSSHFHLKCDRCQKLIHMDCGFMKEMQQHIEKNHGFAVDAETLPENARVTHRSLFDGSLQGFELVGQPAFCLQGHPEASPGPHDLDVLFEKFAKSLAEYRRR